MTRLFFNVFHDYTSEKVLFYHVPLDRQIILVCLRVFWRHFFCAKWSKVTKKYVQYFHDVRTYEYDVLYGFEAVFILLRRLRQNAFQTATKISSGNFLSEFTVKFWYCATVAPTLHSILREMRSYGRNSITYYTIVYNYYDVLLRCRT